MALSILGQRLLVATIPMRVCLTSSAAMSSLPAKAPASEVGKIKPVKKRESIGSWLATVFGGKIETADPNDEPIDANDMRLPNAVDVATGEHKLLLLAFENGFIDPYCNMAESRGNRGLTKDDPIPIPSFHDERIVACCCEPAQSFFRSTFVYRGEKKRCECGYWMELVDSPRFWKKIPKEDLVTIPYFKFLDDEGILDLLLADEVDRELEDKWIFGKTSGHH